MRTLEKIQAELNNGFFHVRSSHAFSVEFSHLGWARRGVYMKKNCPVCQGYPPPSPPSPSLPPLPPFGTVTGGTKHIGSNLKICQKTMYLALKVLHQKYHVLFSVERPFVLMNFRNILKKGEEILERPAW